MSNFVQSPCDQAVISSRVSAVPGPKSSGPWILVATILGSSIAFIDGTVVNIALPELQARLGATVLDAQWVIEAYSLFLTALLLAGGAMGDLYGRRRVFLIGVALFSIASLGCGLAGSVRQLIAARAVQGVGAALLVPGSLSIIGASFQGEERGRAIGTWAGFTAITTAIGPVLGGWLIERYSWRSIFFINLPLAFAVWLICLVHVPESRDEKNDGRLDGWGALIATLGLGLLVYGLIESSQSGFRNWRVAAALLAAVFLGALFVLVQSAVKNPMLPLELFRSRNFVGANLLTFLLYSALGGMFFFLPLNLIQVQKYTPAEAGSAMLPFILTMFLLSRWSGGLVKRYGPRLPLLGGPLVAALGFLLFSLAGAPAVYWRDFFPATLILGLGMACSVAPLTTTVMGAVSNERVGIASGVNNAVARAASLVAIAVFGIVMLQIFNRGLDSRLSSIALPPEVRQSVDDQRTRLAGIVPPENVLPWQQNRIRKAVAESFVRGFRVVSLISGLLAIAGAVVAWVVVENDDPSMKPED